MIQGQNVYINLLLSLLSQKVRVPTDFHDRVLKIRQMLDSDTSGLVDTLSQFQVDCATVDLKVESENDTLDNILNDKWLKKLNKEFRGMGIERGIQGLMKEYYKERWRGASFPVLKILKWESIDGVNLPVSMAFVEGGSVYAKDKDASKTTLDLFGFDYFIGKNTKEKVDPKSGAYFMYKPFSRWHYKYPSPYLVARGIYKNWKIIDMLKDKELELVEQVIPYLFHIIKGDKDLQLSNDPVTYDAQDLKNVVNKMDELIKKMSSGEKKTPTKVTNWDEQMKHLIPDMEAMFKRELFVSAERNVLSGFGFVDVIDAVSTSRKESVLNPKAFIKEVNVGIRGFVMIVEDLIELIREKNPGHPKFKAKEWKVIAPKCSEFLTDTVAKMLRSLRDRGELSEETATDVLGYGYTDSGIEEYRLKKEEKKVIKPKANQVQDLKIIAEIEAIKNPDEGEQGQIMCECTKCGHLEKLEEGEHCIDQECPKCGEQMRRKDRPGTGKPVTKKTKEPEKVTDDKKGAEKTNNNYSKLEVRGAPYANVTELPVNIQKMTIKNQRKWLKIWNATFKFYLKKLKNKKRAEQLAFMTANDRVKGDKK